jgi:uncharacterized membrane protein YtjA (UPF0391 family)
MYLWPWIFLIVALAFFFVPYGGYYTGPGHWAGYILFALFMLLFVSLLLSPRRPRRGPLV